MLFKSNLWQVWLEKLFLILYKMMLLYELVYQIDKFCLQEANQFLALRNT